MHSTIYIEISRGDLLLAVISIVLLLRARHFYCWPLFVLSLSDITSYAVISATIYFGVIIDGRRYDAASIQSSTWTKIFCERSPDFGLYNNGDSLPTLPRPRGKLIPRMHNLLLHLAHK